MTCAFILNIKEINNSHLLCLDGHVRGEEPFNPAITAQNKIAMNYFFCIPNDSCIGIQHV
jgi:hypothetical protein